MNFRIFSNLERRAINEFLRGQRLSKDGTIRQLKHRVYKFGSNLEADMTLMRAFQARVNEPATTRPAKKPLPAKMKSRSPKAT